MLADLLIRLRSLFRRRTVEAELDEELRFHLEQQVEKYIQSGLTREEAARNARLHFGGIDQVKEECREARGVSLVETLAQDIRYGLRTFQRNPGFTTVVVLTLALGIGANTAIFSLINAALLKMLPVRDPERLVQFENVGPAGPANYAFPYPALKQFRGRTDTFAGVFAFAPVRDIDFEVDGHGGNANGQVVSGDYFSTLGVKAIHGRTIMPEDEKFAGEKAVVVISYNYWHARFALDPAVIGKNIVLNNTQFTIIGVTSPEFFGVQPGEQIDVTVPITMMGGSGRVTLRLAADTTR